MQHAKMHEPRGRSDVREMAFAVVVKQWFRLGPVEFRVAGTDCNFVQSVVVEVANLRGHAAVPASDSRLLGDITEGTVAVIAEQNLPSRGRDRSTVEFGLDHGFDC